MGHESVVGVEEFRDADPGDHDASVAVPSSEDAQASAVTQDRADGLGLIAVRGSHGDAIDGDGGTGHGSFGIKNRTTLHDAGGHYGTGGHRLGVGADRVRGRELIQRPAIGGRRIECEVKSIFAERNGAERHPTLFRSRGGAETGERVEGLGYHGSGRGQRIRASLTSVLFTCPSLAVG
jgi:hypothetical protein